MFSHSTIPPMPPGPKASNSAPSVQAITPSDPGRELDVVDYPHPVLSMRAMPVAEVNQHLFAVAEQMVELMYEYEGIGLAAPQVALPWRMFVVDVPEDTESNPPRSASTTPPTATPGPMIFVNPVLSDPTGSVEPYEEGCLSLPGIKGDVLRPPVITVTALDQNGQSFTLTAGGLLARCIQHEYDHLEGVLILDKMAPMHRLRARPKVKLLEKRFES